MAAQDEVDPAPLPLAELRQKIESGHVDTVLVAFTDMQGRLQGKRFHARHFLTDVLDHGTETCNYLLAVDVDMNTVDGYDLTSWSKGYGDFQLRPDLSTLRPVPWTPGTAMVQCDVYAMDGSAVAVDPRRILRAQVEKAAVEVNVKALSGTELEFMIFDASYEDAWDLRYVGLTPATKYNVDYSVLGTSGVEPLVRDIRNAMYSAGLDVESAKGECNLGQQEIAFKYAEVLKTADQHAVYKNAAKEIARRHGKAITFMAKFDEREGNSCHIHMSLRGTDDELSFVDRVVAEDGEAHEVPSALFQRFLAGVLATMYDFTLLYAPNINSYKRFQEGSFAPTRIAWGRDNRTCAVRVVGHGASLRIENRLPGGDVNPYLALAAMLGGGLYGIQHRIPLDSTDRRFREVTGNAYDQSMLDSVPTTLRAARNAFAASDIAKAVFGEKVVKHYVHAADVELAAYEGAVTDWERIRGFERL